MKCLGGCGQGVEGSKLCHPCWYLLAGMCLGKKRFNGMKYAMKAAGQMAYAHQAAYRCLVCGKPHLGGLGAGTEGITSRRAQIVQAMRRNGAGWLLTKLAGEFETMDRNEWKARR